MTYNLEVIRRKIDFEDLSQNHLCDFSQRIPEFLNPQNFCFEDFLQKEIFRGEKMSIDIYALTVML